MRPLRFDPRMPAPHRLLRVLTLGLALAACHRAPIGSQPIPLPDAPPWLTLLADSTFRIAMDTAHLQPGPQHGWFVWFVTAHARPQGPDSLRFDRGRIRLLVRCEPLAFKSVSQELALRGSRPVFHKAWPQTGPDSVAWRVPQPDATDARFLRAACALLERRRLRTSAPAPIE